MTHKAVHDAFSIYYPMGRIYSKNDVLREQYPNCTKLIGEKPESDMHKSHQKGTNPHQKASEELCKLGERLCLCECTTNHSKNCQKHAHLSIV